MKSRTIKLLTGIIGTLALISSGSALAQDTDAYEVLTEKFRALVPQAGIIAIADSPVEGLVEVRLDSEILYASSDGKYLVQGRVIDMDTRQDMTDASRARIRKTQLDEIDRAQQIVFAPEEVAHELLVFTDIDCGYCRRLHNQMAEYNAEGISIRYMMFPRAGVGSHSFEKAVSVWCAADQRIALTAAKNGDEPEVLQCDNPIENQYITGQELGVSGTPALITPDGQMIPGYVPPKALRQRLDALAEIANAAE